MYVDEVGHEAMRVFESDHERYLSLTGVIMRLDYAGGEFFERMEDLKSVYFDSHHPDDPVIFHRTEMVKRRGPFSVLSDSEVAEAFNYKLLRLMRATNFTVITVGIDKLSHKNHYSDPAHPYHYLLEVLVERYVRFLEMKGARGDIFFESRGAKKDQQLQEEFVALREGGNRNLRTRALEKRLCKDGLVFKREDQNVAGLQLADIIAFPSLRYLVCTDQAKELDNGMTSQIVELLLDDKYRRTPGGRIEGYGTKWLK